MKDRHIITASTGVRRSQHSLRDKLHETNARLAAIVENSDDAVFSKDLNGIITSWNKAAERIYGYREAEIIGRPVTLLAPPELSEDIRRIIDEMRLGKRVEHFETVRVRKDGRHINMSLTISPIRDSSGNIIGSSTIGRDITKQVQDTELIRKQSHILNQIRESVITTDLDGTITGWNSGATRMFSYTEEEALGQHISFIYPEHQSIFLDREVIGPLKKHGEHECEVLLRRKSGEEFPALLLLTLLKNGNGTVTGMVGSTMDISGRKKSEEQVKLAKEEWEQTFDAMPDVVAVIDRQFVIRRANKALADRLAIDRQDLIGKHCHEMICGMETPTDICPGNQAVSTGREQVEERFIEKLNGHQLISCTPLFAPDGRITNFVEVCRDISDQKRMEHKLREAATTDELTGLLNRRGFFTTAEHQLHVAFREARSVSLLYLDLNNMKDINDRFGHQNGDLALKDTADLLRKTFRESDIIARLGGDEFAVMLLNPPRTGILETVSSHLHLNITAFNSRGDRPYHVFLSMGLASSDPVQRCTLEELLMKADTLMYRQKKETRHSREITSWIAGEKRLKRLYDRIMVDELWRGELEDIGDCEIVNVSAKGVCLKASRPIDVGGRYRIVIHSPHRDISHDLVGIWCRPSPSLMSNGAVRYTAGMSIVELEAGALLSAAV